MAKGGLARYNPRKSERKIHKNDNAPHANAKSWLSPCRLCIACAAALWIILLRAASRRSVASKSSTAGAWSLHKETQKQKNHGSVTVWYIISRGIRVYHGHMAMRAIQTFLRASPYVVTAHEVISTHIPSFVHSHSFVHSFVHSWKPFTRSSIHFSRSLLVCLPCRSLLR